MTDYERDDGNGMIFEIVKVEVGLEGGGRDEGGECKETFAFHHST